MLFKSMHLPHGKLTVTNKTLPALCCAFTSHELLQHSFQHLNETHTLLQRVTLPNLPFLV